MMRFIVEIPDDLITGSAATEVMNLRDIIQDGLGHNDASERITVAPMDDRKIAERGFTKIEDVIVP